MAPRTPLGWTSIGSVVAGRDYNCGQCGARARGLEATRPTCERRVARATCRAIDVAGGVITWPIGTNLPPRELAGPVDTAVPPEALARTTPTNAGWTPLCRAIRSQETRYPPPGARSILSPFDGAIVECVTEEAVMLFRPYTTSPAFVCGQEPRVIPLIGAERYQVRQSSTVYRFKRWQNAVT